MPENENKSQLRPDDRGVYTLANDAVVEWFQAFIRSFRKTNPALSLTVIPYDKATSKLRALTKEYQFTIMEESECGHFDTLEGVVMGQNRSAGMFRKWACFFGPYAEFIYLDADIVFTTPIGEILDAFSATSYDLLYFDVCPTMVYRPEAISEMKAKYGSVGFNAGAFVSRRGIVSYDELLNSSQKAAGDWNKFVIDQVDQPFLNYVFDTSRRSMICIDKVLPKFAAFATVRQQLSYNWSTDEAIDAEGKTMPFVHWPGCAYPTMHRPNIFLRHRTSGFSFIARTGYYLLFYYRRYKAYFLKEKKHWNKVIIQLFSSKAWRKFYLCKMIGIKLETPT